MCRGWALACRMEILAALRGATAWAASAVRVPLAWVCWHVCARVCVCQSGALRALRALRALLRRAACRRETRWAHGCWGRSGEGACEGACDSVCCERAKGSAGRASTLTSARVASVGGAVERSKGSPRDARILDLPACPHSPPHTPPRTIRCYSASRIYPADSG